MGRYTFRFSHNIEWCKTRRCNTTVTIQFIYIDILFLTLKQSGLDCHVGLTDAEAMPKLL